MRKAILLLPLFMAITASTLAQEAQGPLGDRAGFYMGSGEGELEAEFTHLQGDVYAVSLQTLVPISDAGGGCGGGIDGEMIMTETGGNFFVENEDYDPKLGDNPVNARICEIGVTFADDGTLVLEERSGCMYYHGASCSFTGELTHEAAGI